MRTWEEFRQYLEVDYFLENRGDEAAVDASMSEIRRSGGAMGGGEQSTIQLSAEKSFTENQQYVSFFSVAERAMFEEGLPAQLLQQQTFKHF